MTLKQYINYLKDNPKGYWFKRKLYGWGWTPVTWQGWLVVVGLIAFALWVGNKLDESGNRVEYLISLFLAVIVGIAIGYNKGETPRWQ